MKILGLGLTLVFALSVSAASGASLYNAEEANGRMEKKNASPSIQDVIANVKVRMESHKTSQMVAMPCFTKASDLKPISYLRTKSVSTTTAANDY